MIKHIFFISFLAGIALAFPNPEEHKSISNVKTNVRDSVLINVNDSPVGESLETAEQRWGGRGWGKGGGGWHNGGGGGWHNGGGGGWKKGGGGGGWKRRGWGRK